MNKRLEKQIRASRRELSIEIASEKWKSRKAKQVALFALLVDQLPSSVRGLRGVTLESLPKRWPLVNS